MRRRCFYSLHLVGLEVYRFHGRRHSAVDVLHHQGVDIKDTSSFLGHSEIGTTANKQSHLIEKVKWSTMDKMSAMVRLT